ncbi:MAG: carboxypeptidase regulatory-like domain-containing protein [Chloracidobacterium sp.]|nr:carboxypeptidase regulatory-like domain-containing protein [Chloracidobacterium sp.]
MRKLRYFFGVMAALAVMAGAALAATVTIPSANTNGGSQRYPLGAYWGYERSAAIYTATEHGMTSGASITGVCWYINSLSTPADTPVVIRFKTTTAANFAAATTFASEIAGATQVFSQTVAGASLTANAWNCFTLDTAFSYTSDNLEVLVEANYGGGGGEGSTAKQVRYSTATNAHQTWLADNTPPSGNGSRNSSRPNIQLIYTPASGPGTVQMSSTAYSGNEGTTVPIIVTRTGGIDGAISVDYATSDVTATAGTCGSGGDYVAASGTLNWADQDGASKTINVTLCSDLAADPGETFDFTLSNPGGGTSIGANNPATVTITDVPPPLSGSYDVPGDYPSLTNNGGIFSAINLSGLAGNIVINITSDLTGETGTHALNEFAGGYSVLIKPSGAAHSITGASGTSLIKLSGADNVRIDGSTAATLFDSNVKGGDNAQGLIGGTPALRELTITNTGTGAIIWIATNGTSGATNNTIRNANLVGPGSFGGQGIIAGSGATFGAAAESGRENSNNTIRNCSVKSVQNGVFTSGDATTPDQNWTIAENNFGSSVTAEKLSYRGALVQGAKDTVITENLVSGVNSSTSTSATMSGILVGGTVHDGATVTKNIIRDIRQNSTIGWGSNGIMINTGSTNANIVVANNFISDVASYGYASGYSQSDNGYGIMVESGGGIKIYYNSISMDTDQMGGIGNTAALNINDLVTAAGVDVRNNIFSNTQTVGNPFGVIDQNTSSGMYSFLDYNDYWGSGAGFNFGRINSVNHATLGAWQTATGLDANSITGDPLFTSATDLRPQFFSPVQDKATPVSVLDDIDGNTRSLVGFTGGTPDIGAKEMLTPTASAVSVSGRVTTANGNGIRNVLISITGGNTPQRLIARTGSFGYYRIDGLEAGNTYVITIQSKNYTFAEPSRVITVNDSLTDIDFTALP